MLHIISSYSAYHTTQAAPSLFRFSRMSSRHAFIQRHSDIRHTSRAAPYKRHTGGMKNKKADFTAGFP